MKIYKFQIVTDAGESICVYAPCRKDAIRLFIEQSGVSESYIKQHCIVRDKGIVEYGVRSDFL